MRRMFTLLLSALLVSAFAGPAMAHPTIDVEPTLPTDLTFAATDNVEYLGRFPEHFGTGGGRLDAERGIYYITDPHLITAYDVSDPANPVAVGRLPMFQTASGTGAALAQEDPDFGTVLLNGEERQVMVLDGGPNISDYDFHVVDITDPANMTVLGSVGVTDHTWTCVSGPNGSCHYVYGRSGHIIDLTNPAQPVNLAHTWRQVVGYGNRGNSPYTHDLTELRPGLVMSAGSASILMDTRDPVLPVELQRIDLRSRFTSLGYHSVEWANGGNDPIVVLGTEIAPNSPTNLAGTDCVGDNSVIETYDASAVVAGYETYYETGDRSAIGAFEKIDAFDAGGRGIFLQGQAPGHVLYCAHWMELAPSFDGGGLMAVSYYDRGTRFVEVAEDGTMSEIGWITAAEGYSGSVQWITDEILYISDYRRGMEVIRLKQDEATGTYSFSNDMVADSSSMKAGHSPLDSDKLPAVSSAVLGLLMLGAELRRRRR